VLIMSKIYHLEVPAKKVSIPALIQAVNLLPNITTLKIHSLSTDETTELTFKELHILCLTKETNSMDIQFCFRTIFKKIKHNIDHRLDSLCRHIPTAGD
ncbi:unnamed protein product, partial [Rotaria sp. Silwood1]